MQYVFNTNTYLLNQNMSQIYIHNLTNYKYLFIYLEYKKQYISIIDICLSIKTSSLTYI